MLSLNLEERWKEYLNEKKIQEEQEKILEDQMPSHNNDKQNDQDKDIYLDETLHIMGDMLTLDKQ